MIFLFWYVFFVVVVVVVVWLAGWLGFVWLVWVLFAFKKPLLFHFLRVYEIFQSKIFS